MSLGTRNSLAKRERKINRQDHLRNLVSKMWKQAPNDRMTLWDKSKHGYKEINGKCAVHWFDGPEVPDIAYSEPQDYEEEDPSTELDSSDESESESDSDNSDSDMD